MGFVKSKRELEAYYNIKDRVFEGAKMMGVIFETRPEIIRRVLPPPLKPADTPGGFIFIAEYPATNLGPGYREAALFVRCSHQGENGSYCLSMPIDSLESRLYNGRDIFGFPKKMARIQLQPDGNRVTGWVERHGVRFIEISIELSGSFPSMPPMGPTFLFKGMPKIDLSPGFDGPVLLCKQTTQIEMKSLNIGKAEVTVHESEFDPWHEIEIEKVLVAYFLVSNNTMKPGQVIGEVPGDEFLPYYFKMTDFYRS